MTKKSNVIEFPRKKRPKSISDAYAAIFEESPELSEGGELVDMKISPLEEEILNMELDDDEGAEL